MPVPSAIFDGPTVELAIRHVTEEALVPTSIDGPELHTLHMASETDVPTTETVFGTFLTAASANSHLQYVLYRA